MIGARDPMGLVGQVLDGQYRVDEFIGEGGFSVVYRGYHTGLGEIVAIKCLKLQAQLGSALVESFVRRFRDEGRILYRLSQGNLHIVRSIASGTTIAPLTGSLVPYTVLEWLEGHSLAQDFDRRRAAGMRGRAPHEAALLFSTAFEAVAYAHEAGVVHRDLNPGNIFLTQTREGVRAKVLDFGVAKIISDHALEMGPRAATIGQIRMFSPAYAAPEQFDEKLGKPGPFTDVYTLAVVFVEALRDLPAIEGDNISTLISQTLDENRRPTPRTLGVNVPDELEDVFVRAMAIQPEKRPQNAGQFWVEMAAALKIRNVSLPSHSPLLKTPPPAPVAAQRSAFGTQTVRMTSPLSGDSGSSPDVARVPSPSSPHQVPSAFASTVAGPAAGDADGRISATMLAPENMGMPQRPAQQQPPQTQIMQQQAHSSPQTQHHQPQQQYQHPPQQQQQQRQQQPAYGPPPPILAIARDAGPPINANETTGSTMLSSRGGSGKIIAVVALLLVLAIGGMAFAFRSHLHLQAAPVATTSAPAVVPSASTLSTAMPIVPPTQATATATPAVTTATSAPPTETAPPVVTATPTSAPIGTAEHPATPATSHPATPVDPNAFDAAAANRSLATPDAILVTCTAAGGQKGVAHVTFASDGSVQKVVVDPPLGGTPAGDCVASRYKIAHCPKFHGAPVTVDHAFHVPK